MRQMSERVKCGHFWWALDPVNSLRWVLSTLLLQNQKHCRYTKLAQVCWGKALCPTR